MARLLVVDDSADILRLVGCQMRADGYEVSLASTGCAALEAVAAQPPDEGRLTALPEINEVVLVGRLLNTPKTRLVNGEHKMARFMLAVDRSYHNGAGKRVRSTAYVPVVAWRAVAQAAEALGKGDAIRTEGRLRTWQSAEGQKYRWEVEADLLEVLHQRQGAEGREPELAGV